MCSILKQDWVFTSLIGRVSLSDPNRFDVQFPGELPDDALPVYARNDSMRPKPIEL